MPTQKLRCYSHSKSREVKGLKFMILCVPRIENCFIISHICQTTLLKTVFINITSENSVKFKRFFFETPWRFKRNYLAASCSHWIYSRKCAIAGMFSFHRFFQSLKLMLWKFKVPSPSLIFTICTRWHYLNTGTSHLQSNHCQSQTQCPSYQMEIWSSLLGPSSWHLLL